MDDSQIINKKEIRFIGLQRSGNHAIINWIAAQCKGNVCFLNNIDPLASRNPFLSCYNNVLTEYSNHMDLKKEATGDFSAKDCLIHSYEELLFDDIIHPDFENNHDNIVGKSLKRYDVLILRDPFNFFASRIKIARREQGFRGYVPLTNERNRNLLVKMWKLYAREFVGVTSHLKNNKVTVNFNNWLVSESYRKELASKLNSAFTDKGREKRVTGSAYGKMGDEIEDKTVLFERWKELSDEIFFEDIFKDRELVTLSRMIFGQIPGTEILTK